MQTFRKILNICFTLIVATCIIFGFIIEFIPRIGVEWYHLTHYWYVWVIMLISAVGFYLTAKK